MTASKSIDNFRCSRRANQSWCLTKLWEACGLCHDDHLGVRAVHHKSLENIPSSEACTRKGYVYYFYKDICRNPEINNVANDYV